MKIPLYVSGGDMIQQIILEVLGSFFLVFMYLSSTDAKTKFTKDGAIQTIILAGSYLGSMMLAGTKLATLKASPINPAVALSIVFWNLEGKTLASAYIFCGASFAGSFVALIFFRFVYKKTTEQLDEIEEEEEDEHNNEALLG